MERSDYGKSNQFGKTIVTPTGVTVKRDGSVTWTAQFTAETGEDEKGGNHCR